MSFRARLLGQSRQVPLLEKRKKGGKGMKDEWYNGPLFGHFFYFSSNGN